MSPRAVHRRSIRRDRRPARSQWRAAFTLVEVLLALSLTVVLALAIYSAIDVFLRMSTAGRESIERMRIARAVLRRMELDIRSVVNRDEESAQATLRGSVTGSGSLPPGETESMLNEASDPIAAYMGAGYGLFGDSRSLVLHLNRPSREVKYASGLQEIQVEPYPTDCKSVSYFLADPGLGGLAGAVGERYAQANADRDSRYEIQGLARTEGDRLVTQFADQRGDLETMADRARVIAPEVRSLELSYFDGLQWHDTWDTVYWGRLPRAVQISLSFEQQSESVITSGDPEAQPRTYARVVFLPISEVYSGELE